MTQKQTFTKFYESVIHIFCSHFFYKKCISIWTQPLQNRIAKSSVLNLRHHITVIDITTGDRWEGERNYKRFTGKKQTGKNKCFHRQNKTKLTLDSLLLVFHFPRFDHIFHLLRNVCKFILLGEIFTIYLKMRYFTCRVDFKFY